MDFIDISLAVIACIVVVALILITVIAFIASKWAGLYMLFILLGVLFALGTIIYTNIKY